MGFNIEERENTRMNERSEYQEQLRQIVRKNLIELFGREKDSRIKVAAECHISPSSISRWTAEKGGALPSSEYVYIIANHFGVTSDWIMTDHGDFHAFDRIRTYADAFIALKTLITNQTLQIESIADPILRYLEEEWQHITKHPNLDNAKKSAWLARIMELYNTPLPDRIEPELWDKIRTSEPGTADTDRIVEFANLARIVGNNEKLLEIRNRYGYDQRKAAQNWIK